MPSIVDISGITVASGSCKKRAGLMPLCAAVALGWVCQGLWLSLSIFTFSYNPAWSILIGASTFAFGIFLSLMSYSLYCDTQKQYRIEVTATEVVLNVSDLVRKTESVSMLLLEDVTYSEWYPDTSTLLIHAPYKTIELPLWSLGARGTDVLDYLQGRGIKICNVLLDDTIPE